MKKYPMAQDVENNFVDPYGDSLVRLAEKELEDEHLPTCNDGNVFTNILKLYYFLIYL